MINAVCTVRVTVPNSAAAGGPVGIQFGPWKKRVGPDGAVTFRFTRCAFLRHTVAPTVRLWMLDGGGRRTHVDKTIDNPVGKRDQVVTLRVPSDNGDAVTPPAPQDRVTVTLAMAFQPDKDIPEGWRVLRYPARPGRRDAHGPDRHAPHRRGRIAPAGRAGTAR